MISLAAGPSAPPPSLRRHDMRDRPVEEERLGVHQAGPPTRLREKVPWVLASDGVPDTVPGFSWRSRLLRIQIGSSPGLEKPLRPHFADHLDKHTCQVRTRLEICQVDNFDRRVAAKPGNEEADGRHADS
jgi:hypothetical protein